MYEEYDELGHSNRDGDGKELYIFDRGSSEVRTFLIFSSRCLKG